LEGDEARAVAGEAHVGDEFSLKHLAREEQLAGFGAESDDVADAVVCRRWRAWHEVADLIGMRHQHQFCGMLFEELLQGIGECVGSVGLEPGRLDGIYFGELFGGYFGCDCGYAGAGVRTNDGGFERPSGLGGDDLAAVMVSQRRGLVCLRAVRRRLELCQP